MTLDDVIVKLVQATAKSYQYKFTKYQKVIVDGKEGVVVDVKRGEDVFNVIFDSKPNPPLYHVLHLVPDSKDMIINCYAEDALEAVN